MCRSTRWARDWRRSTITWPRCPPPPRRSASPPAESPSSRAVAGRGVGARPERAPGPSLAAGGDGGLRSGLGTDRTAARVTPDELAQDRGRVADIAAPGQRLELARLLRLEVAGVLVDVDPDAQAVRVQFGVKL